VLLLRNVVRGVRYKKKLLPRERRKAKVINILLSKNVEGESKKSAVIKAKVIKKYYYRGNVVRRKL